MADCDYFRYEHTAADCDYFSGLNSSSVLTRMVALSKGWQWRFKSANARNFWMLLPACEQQANHSTNGCATNRFIGHDLMAVWLWILSFCPLFVGFHGHVLC